MIWLSSSKSILVQMFDRLQLLSDGQTIFFGPTNEAVEYFDNIGWKCPPLWNAADFLLDLIATVGWIIGYRSSHTMESCPTDK